MSGASPSGSTRTSVPLGAPGRLALDAGLTDTKERDAAVAVVASQKYPFAPVDSA